MAHHFVQIPKVVVLAFVFFGVMMMMACCCRGGGGRHMFAVRAFQHHQYPSPFRVTAVASPIKHITDRSSRIPRKHQHQQRNAHHFSASTSSLSSVASSGSSSSSDTTSAHSTSTPVSSSSTSSTSSTSAPVPKLLRRVKTVDAVAVAASMADSDNEAVLVKGWVRTVRKQKTLAFLQVNDGSNLAGIQCVVSLLESESSSSDETSNAAKMRTALNRVTTGCAVQVTGRLVPSTGGEQAMELQVQDLMVVGDCPADTYPLAKKRHSLEYLRSLAHLRPRTNTIAAIARVRSRLAGAIHAFFQTQGFVYVQTPLITASDCEGAGELFRVTTLNLDNIDEIVAKGDEKDGKKKDDDDDKKTLPKSRGGVDYKQDFFGKAAYLTVSGQLGAETHACALGDVYTFGPTFRAENSQTTRHLAEFHMVEPEMAFCDLHGAMQNAESLIQYVVRQILEHCQEDLQFFQQFYDKTLIERLERLTTQPFVRISYRQAIEYLQQEIAKDASKWQFPHVEFGTDLATEHERWLAETKFDNSAVFVYNYPKSIKAFYMRDNDDDNGETVNAMDLLVPGVGELVGGSQREERLDVLLQKIKDAPGNLNVDDYWWYLDLRRYGSVPHAGYGLGFERFVTYVCGIENIREAIAFPRYPGNAEF
jgi:asparaginyl-tRNA synthetase